MTVGECGYMWVPSLLGANHLKEAVDQDSFVTEVHGAPSFVQIRCDGVDHSLGAPLAVPTCNTFGGDGCDGSTGQKQCADRPLGLRLK